MGPSGARAASKVGNQRRSPQKAAVTASGRLWEGARSFRVFLHTEYTTNGIKSLPFGVILISATMA